MAYSGNEQFFVAVSVDRSLTSIPAVVRRYKAHGYYDDGEGHIGCRFWGLTYWHIWRDGSYQLTGSIIGSHHAQYRELEAQP